MIYGLTLALSCDIRINSEQATFGFPEVTIGVPIMLNETEMHMQKRMHKLAWLFFAILSLPYLLVYFHRVAPAIVADLLMAEFRFAFVIATTVLVVTSFSIVFLRETHATIQGRN